MCNWLTRANTGLSLIAVLVLLSGFRLKMVDPDRMNCKFEERLFLLAFLPPLSPDNQSEFGTRVNIFRRTAAFRCLAKS